MQRLCETADIELSHWRHHKYPQRCRKTFPLVGIMLCQRVPSIVGRLRADGTVDEKYSIRI